MYALRVMTEGHTINIGITLINACQLDFHSPTLTYCVENSSDVLSGLMGDEMKLASLCAKSLES